MPAKPHSKPRRVAFMLDLEWPFKRHANIFAGAQHYAQEHGWESTIDDYVDCKLPLQRTKSLPYDGVIARSSKNLAERASRLDLPVVNVWAASPAWRGLPGVFSESGAVGRLVAEHLLARGLRRFAVLGSDDRGTKSEVSAFAATVREAGYPCVRERLTLHPRHTFAAWQKFEQRIERFMQQWEPPIGVYASRESLGRMVVQIGRQHGWRVPNDVAIVAGTNEESLCEHPRPSLTSVEYGYERIGYEAARLLDRLMVQKANKRKKKTSPPEHIQLPPTRLVVRESTDFFAVDDPLIAEALTFIAANSQRQINSHDLAGVLNIGLRSLQNRFSEVVGRSISAEIQRVRIERAKRELSQSKRPIHEIAHDVGFGRAMRMYEVFRRELGVTPREYRKQRQMEAAS